MLIWYKMMHKFSYEHNIEHNRSKIRALQPKIIDLEANHANLVIKSYTNCDIIAIVMSIILSIIGKFLSIAQKRNR